MAAYVSAPVPVTSLDGGLLRVGTAPPADATVAELDLHGATLYVDLERLDAVPCSVVDDATRALWWLEFVYGDDVADEVRRQVEAGSAGSPIASDPVAVPGLLAAPVMRFAVGAWLWRWWPSADGAGVRLGRAGESWLRTELGTLAWYAEDAFGGLAVARALLADQVESVRLRAAADAGTARPLALVRAVIESVPLTDERYEQLAALEHAIVTADRAVGQADLDAAARHLRERDGAVLSGGRAPRRRVIASGVTTVEWCRVRPRRLSAAENNVTWTVHETATAAELSVRVLAGDRWDGGAVWAAARRDGAADPEVVIELRPDDDGTNLVGQVELADATGAETLDIVVFDETDLAIERSAATETPARRAALAAAVRDRVEELTALPGSAVPDLAAYAVHPAAPWPAAAPGRRVAR